MVCVEYLETAAGAAPQVRRVRRDENGVAGNCRWRRRPPLAAYVDCDESGAPGNRLPRNGGRYYGVYSWPGASCLVMRADIAGCFFLLCGMLVAYK